MDGSIVLGSGRRKRLLELYRTEPDLQVRLPAHVVLLLADGHAWAVIARVLFCSTATIARWKRRFEAGAGSRPCWMSAAAAGRRGSSAGRCCLCSGSRG